MSEKKGLEIITAQKHFLETLIESKKLPVHVKTVEDAFTIAQMGRELGFATMQAFHYIIPIQGRLSLSAKAIGALLRKGKITYTTLEDAMYVFADGTTSEYPLKGEIRAVDRRTKILFKRGTETEETSFNWTDAIKMDLHQKSNWVKMPKEMLYARCLSKGANRIGADLLLGLYSADEMFDSVAHNVKVNRDEDGQITEVVDTVGEVVA